MKPNNPPAFPSATAPSVHGCWGMTLRDYFAAKAMQAFLTRSSSMTCPDEIIAQDAYNVADAMLEARKP